ncbi:MAG: TetR family transcriptional regulator [Nitratireductor sp.]|nr:TetR family transcriptional regulator [Nitratireductor sp.]
MRRKSRTGDGDGNTRQRILDAAERLLAEKSYHAVSTRMITEAAEANTAALHYHFGTKEAVVQAIFERRLGPINRKRIKLLDAFENQQEPDLEEVLKAFIGPTLMLNASEGERYFKMLSSNISMDPSEELRRFSFDFYREVGEKFVRLIARVCPHLTPEELFWRMGCVYGAMVYIRADNGRLQLILGHELSFRNDTRGLEMMARFLAAGLKAPAVF